MKSKLDPKMNDKNPPPTIQLDPSMWIEKYGDYLYRFAVSRLRDGDAAEEAVQDTMVSALKNVKQFAGLGNEQAWLLGILKRKIIDFYRSRNRNPINVDEESGNISEMLFDANGSWRKEVRSVIGQSLDSLDRKEFWAILRNCMESLPVRQADVFAMRTIDERPAEDICKEMEISPSNYWVILHRARLQLSSCMKQRWFEENA